MGANKQKNIMAFFKKPAGTGSKLSATATAALAETVAAKSKNNKTSTASLDESTLARIEANRAAARAKLLERAASSSATSASFGASLEPTWRAALRATTSEPFWKDLASFVLEERTKGTVYPPPERLFSAFNHSALSRTKVVMIGQDPYHGPRQANGLCFSVSPGVPLPPSLRNIFKELESDVPGFTIPKSGSLEAWANQGVLLLNAVLTVRQGSPNSHAGRGWERFTDAVVAALNSREGSGIVFMLWGGYAKRKGAKINQKKHCVLTSTHPSPLSANRGGWFGTGHFSKANDYLEKTQKQPINWIL